MTAKYELISYTGASAGILVQPTRRRLLGRRFMMFVKHECVRPTVSQNLRLGGSAILL